MTLLLPIHIVAGAVAIVTGAVALMVAKGSFVHRKGGLTFVYAMIAMGTTGSILALVRQGFSANFLGGFTSVYFVATALATVRPTVSRLRDGGAMLLGFILVAIELAIGAVAVANGHFFIRGVPVPMLFFLAAVTLGGAIGDLRVLRGGPLRGAPRLRRHLWRMCFALFIAAGSFFSIRARVARVLPEPFLSAPMRVLPIVLVFAAMFYWLWKLRQRDRPVMMQSV